MQKVQGSAGAQNQVSCLGMLPPWCPWSIEGSLSSWRCLLLHLEQEKPHIEAGDILSPCLQLPPGSGIPASRPPVWIILACCWSCLQFVPEKPTRQAAVTDALPQAKQHCSTFSDGTKDVFSGSHCLCRCCSRPGPHFCTQSTKLSSLLHCQSWIASSSLLQGRSVALTNNWFRNGQLDKGPLFSPF